VTGTDAKMRHTNTGQDLLRPAAVLAASFVMGMLTFWGQGALPGALRSLSNSAGAWTLITFTLVSWSRAGVLPAAALGLTSFLLLNVGYASAAALRGLTWSISPTNFWVAVGFVAGPLVGLGATWLRDRRDVLAAVGVAGLGGLLLGEAWYGLTTVADTTSPMYWSMSAVLGIGLVVWACRARLHGAAPKVVAAVGAVLVAAAIPFAYGLLS
jgi:hypothetical protein